MTTTTCEQTEASPDTLPPFRFDSRNFTVAHRVEAMNELLNGFYEYGHPTVSRQPNTSAQTELHLAVQSWTVDNLVATCFSNSPLVAKARKPAGSMFSDFLFVRLPLKGRALAQCGESGAILEPGKIHVMRPQNTVHPFDEGKVLGLFLPFDSVSYDPKRQPRLMSYDCDTAAGRIVTGGLMSLFEALPKQTPAQAREAMPIARGLIQGLLNHAKPSEFAMTAINATRAASMHRYVRVNLRDPDLDARKLQVAFNASRATVYRAFEPVGGVAKFIQDERLMAARRELGCATRQRGLVRRISERYCFSDQGSFSKAFRRFHGMPPSDVANGVMRDSNRPET